MAGPGILSLSRTVKYCNKLADEIMKLRGEKYLMDFKINVKDDEFPCAKFVMAAHSPMLRAMLTSDMAEVAKQEIRLDHIRKDIIQIILDYMYCEDVSFHKDQLMDLLAASDYLQMTELKEMCLDEVPDILEPGNVIEWWKEAIKMNYHQIKGKCEELMAAHFKQISQQTAFLNLEITEMQHYVCDICSGTVSSDDIVDATLRWVSHEEERVSLLEDLLRNVQLNKCSDEGIKAITKAHEALFDKVPMVYKLLLNTPVDTSTNTPSTSTNTPKDKNDIIFILGGKVYDDDGDVVVSRDCWKVNPSTGFENMVNIPVEDLAVDFSVCMIPQGFVITGGEDKRLCIMFTAATKSWVRLQDLLEPRDSHGSICVKDVLYLIGGYLGRDSVDMLDSVDMMTMKDGVWKKGPNIPLAVEYPKVSNIGDSVYLLDENTEQLWHLDVDNKIWKQLAPFPVEDECYGVSMTSAQGRLFVAGGGHMICAWYTPDSNAWCTGKQPLREHEYGALAYHDDKLLLLGGSKWSGTDEVEEYDIDGDKWSVCSYKMPKKTLSIIMPWC